MIEKLLLLVSFLHYVNWASLSKKCMSPLVETDQGTPATELSDRVACSAVSYSKFLTDSLWNDWMLSDVSTYITMFFSLSLLAVVTLRLYDECICCVVSFCMWCFMCGLFDTYIAFWGVWVGDLYLGLPHDDGLVLQVSYQFVFSIFLRYPYLLFR